MIGTYGRMRCKTSAAADVIRRCTTGLFLDCQPGTTKSFVYVMENVTIFILGMSQKPDVTMSAFPFISSRSQSVCMSEVLRMIEVVEGLGRVSLAG